MMILKFQRKNYQNNGLGMVFKGLWDKFSQNETCVQNDVVNLLSQIEGTSSKVQEYNENIYLRILMFYTLSHV